MLKWSGSDQILHVYQPEVVNVTEPYALFKQHAEAERGVVTVCTWPIDPALPPPLFLGFLGFLSGPGGDFSPAHFTLQTLKKGDLFVRPEFKPCYTGETWEFYRNNIYR